MEYLNFLKEINYLSYAGACFKWLLLFLLASLALLVLAHRFGLFVRRKRVARLLVKLYYLIVPLYFVLFAVKFAPIRNTQKEFNKAVDIHKEEVIRFTREFFIAYNADSALNQEISAQVLVNSYLEKYIYFNLEEDLSGKGWSKRIIYKFKRRIEFNFLSRLLESKIVKKASEVAGIDENTGKALYRTSFHDLFEEGEIVELFKSEVNRFFNKFYKGFFFVFLLGLTLPALEIILAKKLNY